MSSEFRISANSRLLAGSRFEDGSSKIKISGFIAKTVATATLLR